MARFTETTTVKIHNKKYYYTPIPKTIAEQMLGLTWEDRKQKLLWKIEQGKIVVEKKD